MFTTIIRILFGFITYILFTLLISIPTIILGWILIPPMALFNKYTTKTETSIINGRHILNWKYKFMYIWSNQEDGIMGAEEYKDKSNFIRIVYWSALRNPSNNLRFIPYLSVKIEPTKVKYIGTKPIRQATTITDISMPEIYKYDDDRFTFISFTWQGLYSNFRWQFKMFDRVWRFWLGWKIYPHDQLGISTSNYRYHGAGFATQFKRIYPRN